MFQPFKFLLTRRGFLVGSVSTLVVIATAKALGFMQSARASTTISPVNSPAFLTTTLTINGKTTKISHDSRTTLLDLLRENLHMTGTKKGCDHGQCGACTVLVEGRRINSCMTLAAMHEGAYITTIEGIGSIENLHPMQAAFIEHDGFQCGYCTPGQICSAIGMLKEMGQGMPSHVSISLTDKMELSDSEIRERMSGNLCRCAAYPNILAAIKEGARVA